MIKVKDLCVSYGKKTVLNNLNFHIEEGQTVGLLGENGAGKSTTMNVLTGYLKPTSGSVLINGYDIVRDSIHAKKSLSYLPEVPPLYKDMKVREYLKFAAQLKKVEDVKAEVSRVLDLFELSEKKNEYIKHLSKGWQQRVGFAYCMIGNPKIIILDEPFVGLDPKEAGHVRSLIHDLSKDRTIIISSHILSDIEELCSEIIMIKDGSVAIEDSLKTTKNKLNIYRLKVKGDKDAVMSSLTQYELLSEASLIAEVEAGVFEYEVKSKNHRDIRDVLFGYLVGKHHNVYQIERCEKTLEDVFLSAGEKEEA